MRETIKQSARAWLERAEAHDEDAGGWFAGIERALADAKAGEVVAHEDAMAEIDATIEEAKASSRQD